MTRLIRSFLLALASIILVATPVFAYLYRAPVAITENASTAYTMLPVMWNQNNDWLASNGFMNSTANDTRVQTLGGLDKPWMVADNKTLTAIPVPANSQTNLYFATGESEASAMDIIVGYGGYVTVADDSTLELGNNFAIETSGWIGGDGNLVYKPGAIKTTYDSGSENITSAILAPSAPTVAATNTSNKTTAGTSHTVSLPSGITSGNLLLVLFSGWASGTNPAPTITWPAGWTNLDKAAGLYSGTDAICAGAAYRVANGGESANITVTTASSVRSAHQSFRITGYQGTPEISTIAGAPTSSATPNSSELTPSWGDQNTVYFTFFGGGVDATRTVSSYPTDYSNGTLTTSTGYAHLGSARRALFATSEDPGAFTLNSGVAWYAWTIGIQGADVSVTATGVSSWEHTVVTSANTTHLSIQVDGGTLYSAALSGASVPDNSNNWLLFQNNVMPFADYYSQSVNGTEVLRYEPDSMVIGTTLPDEVGTYNGIITWGTNPAGVGVTLGSMSSSGQPSIGGASDTSTGDILPPVGGTDWRPDAGVSATLQANPIRPIVTAISDNTTLSEYQVWVWFGIIFVIFITVLVGARVRGHHLITGIAASAAIILLVVWTVFPLLSLLVVVLAIWGGLVSERSPSL